MRGIFYLTLLCFFTFQLNAQTIKVVYREQKSVSEKIKNHPKAEIRASTKRIEEPVYFVLSYSNEISTYHIAEEKQDGEIVVEDTHVQVHNDDLRTFYVFQDRRRNKLVCKLARFNKTYVIKDTIPEYQWQVQDVTKKIGNYSCKEAVAFQEGKKVTAWYTDEIPIQIGPRLFSGLPGLILYIKEGRKTIVAEQVLVMEDSSVLSEPDYQEEEVINWESYHSLTGTVPEYGRKFQNWEDN